MNEADAQATMAKARRVVRKDGGGGFAATRAKKAKRSEQVKPASGKGFGKPAGLNYDRVPAATAACACDNGQTYGDCACSTLHKFMRKPESPIELVRARYTAYAYRLPDYLMRTTDPEGDEWDADVTSWKKGLLGFCDDFEFQGLTVGDVREGVGSISAAASDAVAEGAAAATLAQVDFKADFRQKGTINLMELHETSTFRLDAEGGWLYAQGDVSYDAQSVQLSEEERAQLHAKLLEQQEAEGRAAQS